MTMKNRPSQNTNIFFLQFFQDFLCWEIDLILQEIRRFWKAREIQRTMRKEQKITVSGSVDEISLVYWQEMVISIDQTMKKRKNSAILFKKIVFL